MIDFFALVSRGAKRTALTGYSAVALAALRGRTQVFFFATLAAFETRLARGFARFASANAFVTKLFVDIAVEVFVADGSCGLGGANFSTGVTHHARTAVVFGLFARFGFFAALGGEITNGSRRTLDIALASGNAAFSAHTATAQAAFFVFGARGRIIGADFVGAAFVLWAIEVVGARLGWGRVRSTAVSIRISDVFNVACGGAFAVFADLTPCTLFILCAISTRTAWAGHHSDRDRRQRTQKHHQTNQCSHHKAPC